MRIGRKEPTLSNPLQITISNGKPNPNGAAARMSRKGKGGLPNLATWRALDKDYTVQLPGDDWDAPAPGPAASLRFTIRKGQTSTSYALDVGGPTGLSGYSIDPPSRERVPPEIMVEP